MKIFGGHGNPLQYSCLENPMVRGAWRATVHGHKELNTAETTEHKHTYFLISLDLYINICTKYDGIPSIYSFLPQPSNNHC